MVAERLKSITSYPAWLVLLAFCLISWFGFEPSGWLVYLPFLVSMVFLGLPHGAVDHLVPYRLQDKPVTLGSLSLFMLVYISISLLYGVVWWFFPALSAIGFIALTWFHWGQGDLYALRRFVSPLAPYDMLQSWLAVIIRGGLPMLMPLIAFPEVYIGFMNDLIGQISPQNLIDVDQQNLALIIWWISLAFAAAVFLYLARGIWLSRNRSERLSVLIDGLEISLLWVYFSAVTPILAVGIYFSVWHSLRHICRLIMIERQAQLDISRRQLWHGFVQFLKDSTPLTGVSLIFLSLLTLFLTGQTANLSELTAIYLILIAMLTLPHTLVVIWMDLLEFSSGQIQQVGS
ncbi:MAG: Brp/Blh family beta-carotene 15,15'-dioxygenase [Chloroflexota bacterium]